MNRKPAARQSGQFQFGVTEGTAADLRQPLGQPGLEGGQFALSGGQFGGQGRLLAQGVAQGGQGPVQGGDVGRRGRCAQPGQEVRPGARGRA